LWLMIEHWVLTESQRSVLLQRLTQPLGMKSPLAPRERQLSELLPELRAGLRPLALVRKDAQEEEQLRELAVSG
jgi:hypothetical protein